MHLTKQLAFLVISIFIAPANVYLQTPQKTTGDAYCMQTIQFFRESVAAAGKGGGLALTDSTCAENEIFSSAQAKQLPLDKKLDLLIEKLPNYKWIETGGAMNLYPSEGIPPILTTRIKEFKITIDANNLTFFMNQLLQSQDVVDEEKKLHIRQGLYIMIEPSSPPNGKPPVEMVFHDKTVQEILNEVVSKRGRVCWIYRESTSTFGFEGQKTYTIEFVRI